MNTTCPDSHLPGRQRSTAATGLGCVAGLALLLGLIAPAAAAPPQIVPSALFQHTAVDLGKSNNFTVSVTGDAPLFFQWRLDGVELLDATDRSFITSNASETDEGDYTIVITNAYGAITSSPTRLWVTPVATNLIKGNYTNASGLRLPYFYCLPANYDPARKYPVACFLHGYPGDETQILEGVPGVGPGYGNLPAAKVLMSCRQQTNDPVIMVWPVRRAGDAYGDWTPQYLQLISSFMDWFIPEHAVDTNRIYIDGYSQGMHAVWDLLAMRPGFFAAARIGAGKQGSFAADAIASVLLRAWCAEDDTHITATREAVRSLLAAGGTPIYTAYQTGGHLGGIFMGATTPANVQWLLAQRRGQPCTNQLRVCVTAPTTAPSLTTAATTISLRGTADALSENVLRVTCTNMTLNAGVAVTGTNDWDTSLVPLRAGSTNRLVVTAVTTSWAPFFGGNTFFSGTLAVFSSPVRASLEIQESNAVLRWTGGAPPFRVEETSDLAGAAWAVTHTNATSPLTIPVSGPSRLFRVLSN